MRVCFIRSESYVRLYCPSVYGADTAVLWNLYNNITDMFPNANIWIIGHSLGGALASLLGITFGVPVVTFESPGERMAAQRLHLPSPVCSHLLVRTNERADRTWDSSAVHSPHHARVAHRRSYSDGYMQWGSFELLIRRICNGKPVRPSDSPEL